MVAEGVEARLNWVFVVVFLVTVINVIFVAVIAIDVIIVDVISVAFIAIDVVSGKKVEE